jgi:hypothetical protein
MYVFIYKKNINSNNSRSYNMAALTTNINFLQSTQFKVIIDRKKFGNLEFFAQAFQHPGVTVTSAPMAYKRIATVGLPGDTLTIDELGFEIIVDEGMNSYIEMYNWAKSQTEDRRGLSGNNPLYRDIPSATDTNEADITVLLMTNSNNVVRTIKYIDCVPTSLSGLNFSATVGEPSQVTFQASFRTEYFIIT